MLLDALATDVRFAVRRLARTPIFTLTMVAPMALGIGANAAVFTALDQTVIRPLPFREPERLVMLREDLSPLGRAPKQRVSPVTFLDWRALSRSFEAMGAFGLDLRTLSGDGAPREVHGARVTADLIPRLGVSPLLGRTFSADEESQANGPVGASVVFVVSTTVSSQSPHSELLRGERYTRESQIAATALKSGDMTAFRAAVADLHEQFPNNSRWLRNLAAAEARLGNRDDAVGHLRVYASMGLTLEPNQPSLAPLAELRNDVPDLKKNAELLTRSSLVFPAPASDLVIEDIAYDSLTKSFFLSSVRRREIFRCDLKGTCVEFVKSSSQLPLGAVLALHADRHHGVLWATTAEVNAAIDFSAQDEGASSVLKFDLNSGRLLKRYSPTDRRKHALGDMTVASNGDAFVSDGLSGDVFFISHKDDQLAALAPVGVFVSPQTPVLSADEKLLYIPDYIGGIAVLRLSDRHIDWVVCTRPAALEGIDGMYRYKDTLIAIQNGTMPERIVSFHLATPTKIDRFDILEGNWQGLGDPTHGIVIGNQLYFVANSGWDRVADDGRFTNGNAAQVFKRGLHRR